MEHHTLVLDNSTMIERGTRVAFASTPATMLSVAHDREHVLDRLRDAGALWPIVDHWSCRTCAQPRLERYGGPDACAQCRRLAARHDSSLNTLLPITYTSYDWKLGRGLREFKDADRCSARSHWALGFGAILSSFLEAQMPRLGRGRYDRIVTVPTSSPVVERSLRRAAREGWWSPSVVSVASVARGFERQRRRNAAQRQTVDPAKWAVDEEALNGAIEVLVVDDMLTTGASLFSFAHALRRSGVAFVDAVVVARNVGQRDATWVRPVLERRVHQAGPWTPETSKSDVMRRPRRSGR